MLIISKWHDYYDTACIYGIDKDCVYERKTEIFDIKDEYAKKNTRLPLLRPYGRPGGSRLHKRFLLGFCGKLYPAVEVFLKEGSKFFYSQEVFKEFVEENGNRFSLDGRFTKGGEDEFWNNDYSRYLSHFRTYNTPVFSVSENKIVTNPNLRDLEFMKVFPPSQAFQEIFMYKSGVLGSAENKMIEIDDKIKLLKKGFFERSFKKDPGQKKRGKKNGRS